MDQNPIYRLGVKVARLVGYLFIPLTLAALVLAVLAMAGVTSWALALAPLGVLATLTILALVLVLPGAGKTYSKDL